MVVGLWETGRVLAGARRKGKNVKVEGWQCAGYDVVVWRNTRKARGLFL
jgi:hypothetical protein